MSPYLVLGCSIRLLFPLTKGMKRRRIQIQTQIFQFPHTTLLQRPPLVLLTLIFHPHVNFVPSLLLSVLLIFIRFGNPEISKPNLVLPQLHEHNVPIDIFFVNVDIILCQVMKGINVR